MNFYDRPQTLLEDRISIGDEAGFFSIHSLQQP